MDILIEVIIQNKRSRVKRRRVHAVSGLTDFVHFLHKLLSLGFLSPCGFASSFHSSFRFALRHHSAALRLPQEQERGRLSPRSKSGDSMLRITTDGLCTDLRPSSAQGLREHSLSAPSVPPGAFGALRRSLSIFDPRALLLSTGSII